MLFLGQLRHTPSNAKDGLTCPWFGAYRNVSYLRISPTITAVPGVRSEPIKLRETIREQLLDADWTLRCKQGSSTLLMMSDHKTFTGAQLPKIFLLGFGGFTKFDREAW